MKTKSASGCSTNMKSGGFTSTSNSHEKSLSCLYTCTQWVLDIADISNPNCPRTLLSLRQPFITYKHCNGIYDQFDQLDEMI